MLPSTTAELLSLMGREDWDAKHLSDVIHRDQALAAHVLRVANAPTLRGVAKIVSLQQAIARLGMRQLSEIALSVSIRTSVFDVRGHDRLARRLWRTAFATALVAKELARAQRHNVEAGFLCGLLHDFGAPIVLRTALLAADALDRDIDDQALGVLVDALSPEVGARMAEQWDMPVRIVAAVRHHRDFREAGRHRYDAALTALARTIADHFLDACDESAIVTHPSVTELNLYDDEIDTVLAKRESIEQALSAVTT